MKKARLFILILTLVLLAVFVLSGCKSKQASKVRLWEVTRSIFYAPQYVAIYEGYFEDEGIDIELYNAGGADKVMTGVLSGQADIGFSGAEAAIYVYNEGHEDYPEVFAQLTQKDGSFLVGREPEPDFKWENLEGKTVIAGRKGGMPAMAFEYILRNHGLVPNEDLEFLLNIQFDLIAGAFTGGTGDYVSLFEPVASNVELEGQGYIVASLGVAAGNIPYTTYYAKQSYMKENEDLITGFTRAIYKGQQYVANHSAEEIAKAIKSAFPETELDRIISVVQRYKEQDTWPLDPRMSQESYERLQDIMEMAGELDQRAPYDKVINNDYAVKVID